MKDQKKKRRNGCNFSKILGSSWLLSLPPETDHSRVHLGSHGSTQMLPRIFFRTLFSPIWTHCPWTEFVWGPFQNLFGPNWVFSLPIDLQQIPLTKPIWAKWVFIPSYMNFFLGSIWAYLDLWPLYTIQLGILLKVFWTKKKNRPWAPFQQPVLSNPIWAKWVFIPSYTNFFLESIWAYLDLWPLYTILLGILSKVIWTKIKN